MLDTWSAWSATGALPGVSRNGASGPALGEEDFRYCLEVERKRAERSRRPFVLLLADVVGQPTGSVRIDADLAARLFAALAWSIRDTDLIGWYREAHVGGAVLTELGESVPADVARLVEERVTKRLGGHLDPVALARLRIRAFRYPDPETGAPRGRPREGSWLRNPPPRPDHVASPPRRRASGSAAGIVAALSGWPGPLTLETTC
jgi:hypothetical protein